MERRCLHSLAMSTLRNEARPCLRVGEVSIHDVQGRLKDPKQDEGTSWIGKAMEERASLMCKAQSRQQKEERGEQVWCAGQAWRAQ